MTFADELRDEGRVEGRAEGRVEGIELGVEKVTINGLKQNIPPKMIAQLTGLSLEGIERIKQEQKL